MDVMKKMNVTIPVDLDPKKIPEYALIILFIIYLVIGNNSLPKSMNEFIETTFSKIITVVIALALFAYSNPVLGVLGLLVCYKLLYGSSNSNNSIHSLFNNTPHPHPHHTNTLDNIKYPYTNSYKNCPPFKEPSVKGGTTLEQEMVAKMTHSNYNTEYQKTDWKPQLEETHNASHYSTAFTPISVPKNF